MLHTTCLLVVWLAALSEACLRFNTGARIGLGEVAERDGLDLFTLLFSSPLAALWFRFRVLRRCFGYVHLRQFPSHVWCGGC